MNYSESQKILKEVKKADNILVGVHKSPDFDTVGCAISLYQVLLELGKEVKVICPDNIPSSLEFLPHFGKIEKVDFGKFNFDKCDLLITVDTPSPKHVTGSSDIPLPGIKKVVVDHHKTNPRYGDINLIDETKGSAAEILYLIFEDWDIKIDKDLATSVLTGIIGDTGIFKYPSVTPETFDIAKKLMDKGADKNKIILHLFGSIGPAQLKFWGEILKSIKIEKGYRFAWSAIPYEEYKQYAGIESGRESAASNFGQIIKGTDFSVFITEEAKNSISVSFRGRTDFDVSEIAAALGGGGHRAAAGARLTSMNFNEAVEKVLDTVKGIVDENKKIS